MLKSKQTRNVLIGLSFVIFALFSILLVGLHGRMYIMNDSLFHSSRLLELIKSRSLFPNYAMNSFNFDGSAVMTMYPYIFLYPIVFIYKIVKSIKMALLLSFALGTLVSLLISYFSSLSYSHNWLISYIFAIIYALSGEATAMYFYSPDSDLGVYFSYLFLPLVIFGFLALLKSNHWLMLSVGMTVIAYSNVISVVFIAGLFFIWFLWNYKLITLARLMSILKAGGLFIITTAAVWLPMGKLMSNNQLRVPTRNYVKPVILFNLFQHALSNNVFVNCQGLTIYSLLGLILGLICFKRLSHFTKQLYIFAVFVIFCSSNLFPWNMFTRNYFIFKWARSIQTTIRLMVIPQIILEFVLAVIIIKYVKSHSVQLRHVAMTMLIIIIGLVQLAVQSSIINQHDSFSSFTQVEKPVIRSHVLDYWPKAAVNYRSMIYKSRIMDDQNGKSYRTFRLGHGYFHFKLRHSTRQLSLPFFQYHATPYQVTLDKRPVQTYSDHHQFMTINHVKAGYHTVHIKIQPMRSTEIAYGLTVIGLLSYGCLMVAMIRKKRS